MIYVMMTCRSLMAKLLVFEIYYMCHVTHVCFPKEKKKTPHYNAE